MQTHFTLRTTLIILAVCLAGCASQSHITLLSESRYHELVMAANQYDGKGGALPEPIRRLNPIEVYHDYGNLVIVLYRNAHEERGYYFYPYTSSESLVGKSKEWSFKLVKGTESTDPGVLYEYRREL
jgi:hypothetical protein